MAENDTKKIYDKLEDVRVELMSMKVDLEHVKDDVYNIMMENKDRDKHLHALDVAKKQAWALAGVGGFLVGIAVNYFK